MLRDKLWRRDQTDSSETRDQRPKFSRLRIDARSPDDRDNVGNSGTTQVAKVVTCNLN